MSTQIDPGVLWNGNEFVKPPEFPNWIAIGINNPIQKGDVLVKLWEYGHKNTRPWQGKPVSESSIGSTAKVWYGYGDKDRWCVYRNASGFWVELEEEMIVQKGDWVLFDPEGKVEQVQATGDGGWMINSVSGQSVGSVLADVHNDYDEAIVVRFLVDGKPPKIKLPLNEFHSRPLPLP